MKTAVVKSGQTLWDVAVEHCGSPGDAFEIARLNGLLPTSRPTTGSFLLVPDISAGKTVAYYASQGLTPASDTRGTYNGVWSDPLCEQANSFYGFQWTDPECVLANPYTFDWQNAVCDMDEGPFLFSWTDPECVAVSTSYQFFWINPICAKSSPYYFAWTDGQCILTSGPYGFSWSNGVCRQYYDNSLEWDPMQ